MICSLTSLVMSVGSGRQGAPKQQEAASATQVRPKKRKGADSADESAMKKAKLEPEAPMKKKPGRPRKQAVQEEAVPEDIPVATTQVRSKMLLLSHLLTSGLSAETMVYPPVAHPIGIHLSAVCDCQLTKWCLSRQQCRLASLLNIRAKLHPSCTLIINMRSLLWLLSEGCRLLHSKVPPHPRCS